MASRLLMCALGALGMAASADGAAPTFTRDVAPILFRHCAGCHDALLTYEAARLAARSIREQVQTHAMPPWPADPARSLRFRNDPRLDARELATVVGWIDAGTPKGNEVDLPRMPDAGQQWLDALGRGPDAVVALPEMHIPASGEVPYVQQLIKVPAGADRWIVAMQLRAGNRRVLHHMGITEVALPKGMGPADIDQLTSMARTLGFPDGSLADMTPAVEDAANANAYDMLGVYTPGTAFESFADDSGKLLKGGENYYLNFNIHYATTGKPESDRSQLALWFRPTPPAHQLFRAPVAVNSIIANGQELLSDSPGTKAEGTLVPIPPIPAYAPDYELIGMSAFTQPVTLFQLQPHAHMRARDFTYLAVYPDGRELPVLTVPAYDFHWQLAYVLDQPLALPAGSKLIVTAHYDNSQAHYQQRVAADDPARSCGPEKVVYFRRQNQTWDEMFSPLAQYAVASADATAPDHGALSTVSVVGCLTPGNSGTWRLNRADEPVVTDSQTTSMAELRAASARHLGAGEFGLLGVGPFHPSSHAGQRVAVKGVWIKGAPGSRINVTSLQRLGASCPP